VNNANLLGLLTAPTAVGAADLLGVTVIVTVCAVLLWLVWLARNWSFEAMAKLELVIMSVAIVQMAVAAYLMLKWQQPKNLPTMPPPIQRSNGSTNHAALPHQAASEIGAPQPQIVSSCLRPQTTKKPREVLARLDNRVCRPCLGTSTIRRVFCLCIISHSYDDKRMTPYN